MKQFGEIQAWISRLGSESAAMMVVAAADLALVIDSDGVVKASGFDDDLFAEDEIQPWVDQLWQETVTGESEQKLTDMRAAAESGEPPRWRHVNHIGPMGDIPVIYATVALDQNGHMLAIGRDLRSSAELQQRLIEAQQLMEQDHSRFRQLDARYRLLEQMTSDGVLLLDGASTRVLETNEKATVMLTKQTADLAQKSLAQDFGFDDPESIQTFLETARSSRSLSQLTLNRNGEAALTACAAGFRSDGAARILVRLTPSDAAPAAQGDDIFTEVVQHAPDAVVVTTDKGRIVRANAAFLDMIQLGTMDQVIGESLETWLGRPGVDLSVLLANLKERGSVRLFATSVRSPQGALSDVEISAVTLPGNSDSANAFLIRAVNQRLSTSGSDQATLPKTMKQMTDLVGRVSLKELVRETTDVIERMCIETALQMTGNNRASAAELLGVSRQILYVKLRKYGLHKSPGSDATS